MRPFTYYVINVLAMFEPFPTFPISYQSPQRQVILLIVHKHLPDAAYFEIVDVFNDDTM